jgi:hypothetical protein
VEGHFLWIVQQKSNHRGRRGNGNRITNGAEGRRGTAEDQQRTTEGAEVAEEQQNSRTASLFLSFFLSFFLSRLWLKEMN